MQLSKFRLDELKLNFERYLSNHPSLKIKHDFHLLDSSLFLDVQRGSVILSEYKGFTKFLEHIYPHLRLTHTDIGTYRNYWNDFQKKKFFLETFSLRHSITLQSHLLDLGNLISGSFYGRSLPEYSTFLKILQSHFPEFFWNKNSKFPSRSTPAEKSIYIDQVILLGHDFVQTQRDLPRIGILAFRDHQNSGAILHNHDHSYLQVWKDSYPHLRPVFANLPGHWKQKVALERFFVESFELERLEHLWSLTKRRVALRPGGGSLLAMHHGSPQYLLAQLYPELHVSGKNQRGYWKEPTNNHSFLLRTLKHFSIQSKCDWYRISIPQFSELYGGTMTMKNLLQALRYWVPEEQWDLDKFSGKTNKKARQRYLGLKLREMFGEEEVMFEEYVWKDEERVVLFDFFFPGMKLVVEYQGEQHYANVLNWKPKEEQAWRDENKRRICALNDLKVIEVPFWWDGSVEHLKNIIYELS